MKLLSQRDTNTNPHVKFSIINNSQDMKVKGTQSCPTLCNPMDYTVHGILQARILEWVVFPFSRVSNPGLPHCRQILYQLSHQGSSRILEWVAYPFSSGSSQPRNQTRVSCNCRQILYQLSYQGSHLGSPI